MFELELDVAPESPLPDEEELGEDMGSSTDGKRKADRSVGCGDATCVDNDGGDGGLGALTSEPRSGAGVVRELEAGFILGRAWNGI